MSKATETEAAIAAIWQRQVPQTRERLMLLARAAEELCRTGAISPQLLAESISVAHKLAGSLGMFGYFQSSEYARRVQQELEQVNLREPDRLKRHVNDLQSSLIKPLQGG